MSKTALKRARQRAAKDLHIQQAQAAGPGSGKGWDNGNKGNKGKGKGPPFRYDRDGVEICYKFAKGGRGGCDDVCPNGRSHCCQNCLGPHPNNECKKGKGKSGGKGHK